MLKYKITYNNYFTDEEETEDVYFHFSQDEMREYIRKNRKRLQGKLRKTADEEDYLEAYSFVRDLMIQAHGVRSDDGKRFIKNSDTRTEFTQSPLLDACMDKAFEDEKSAQAFINGVMPAKMRDLIEKELESKGEIATK